MSNTERKRVLNYRNDKGLAPNPDNIEHGEIAIGYKKGSEAIYIKNSADEIVDFTPISIVNLTYSELKNLRDNSKLKPSQYYRITDFVTTVANVTEAQSAGHPFDIIVCALDKDKLQEECSAIQHEGDTYFANCNLAAWKIWYCLDNDNTKYAWADTVNGKGVIYRMIDELNNDCPYDFKNVQFKRYWADDINANLHGYYGTSSNADNTNDHLFLFTFTRLNNISLEYEKGSVMQSNVLDESIQTEGFLNFRNRCRNNILKPTTTDLLVDTKSYMTFILLNNVFITVKIVEYEAYLPPFENKFGYECSNNTFGNWCGNNTFGDSCTNNKFGYECSNNTFGYECSNNTFGNSCSSNTFGNWCGSNTLSSSCSNNTLGGMCSDITFGSSCSYNTFGNRCSNIIFGNWCGNNTFGESCSPTTRETIFGYSCSYNTFGNGCGDNRFGNECSYNTFGNWCGNNTFGDSCTNNKFGYTCTNNTFGNSCNKNTFKNNCLENTFGNGCGDNRFGNECSSNHFGDECSNNAFGDSCSNNSSENLFNGNTFGNSCSSNTFGEFCSNNTFGNSCSSNHFGGECGNNTFGNSCSSNTFGNACGGNTFGIGCNSNTFGNSFVYNALGNNIQYIEIPTEKIYNTQVLNGTKGTQSNKLTLEFTPETTYSQFAGLTSDGVLETWVEADAPHDVVDGGSY